MPDTALIEGNQRRVRVHFLTGRPLKQERRCAVGRSGHSLLGGSFGHGVTKAADAFGAVIITLDGRLLDLGALLG